jgi:hypothetical protein
MKGAQQGALKILVQSVVVKANRTSWLIHTFFPCGAYLQRRKFLCAGIPGRVAWFWCYTCLVGSFSQMVKSI